MNNALLLRLRKLNQIVRDKKSGSVKKISDVIAHEDVSYFNDGNAWHTLDVYSPSLLTKKFPIVIYVHGGGWCMSDKKNYRHFCQAVSSAGYVVFNSNYRLAPEYKHPAQFNDILDMMEWVKLYAPDYGADPEKVFFAGDSAGAHLASLAACLCTNSELEKFYHKKAPFARSELLGCILFCGIYDIESCIRTSFPFIKRFVKALLGVKKISSFSDIGSLSTIHNITARYPPCFVSDATKDPLIEESRTLVEALKKNNVSHTASLLDDVGKLLAHEYQVEYDKPVFIRCLKECLDFMAQCSSSSMH